MESYKSYLRIAQGGHPFVRFGARVVPAYYGCDIDPGFAPYCAAGLIPIPEKVYIDFGNGKRHEAMEYQTIFIDSALIMKELHRACVELGILITLEEVTSFNEVHESIIFNCTGLGAKKLTGDHRIIPVQGHLILLQNQPPLEELQYLINVKVTMTNAFGGLRDELIYYAPKESGIVGITFIRGQDSVTANQHEFERLIQRCQEFFGESLLKSISPESQLTI